MPTAMLIPIHDDNPTRSFSLVSAILIALNVGFFLLEPQLGQGGSCELARFLYRWAVVPREITEGQALAGEVCPGVAFADKSIYLSLLSSMFLHGGFLHLGGNMLFLWVFGNNIEDTLGKFRYIIFYLLTGLLAGLAHVLANPDSVLPTIGASGAVSGLLGAYIVLFPKARVTTIVPIFFFLQFMKLPAVVVLGLWFASQFFIGQGQQAGGGVAWVAHVGGFVAGAVLIKLFAWGRSRPARDVYMD